ncbi:unnamed protein product [Notodromas monacha]|uniref:Nucleoporin NSP1-like C-terminal domain-containing protein n=1 Tax=Notodromas monacha TaxID=399045 RepID=A0A7R9BVR8_9CRUS|nr:unnamed protein product [Notodromas monacha]CAG0922693.1 unnamed protein product [Notodromas monacha]
MASGFNFGQATPAAKPAGFTFGSSSAAPAAAMQAPAATPSAGSSFSFGLGGATSSTQPATGSSTMGFSFGSNLGGVASTTAPAAAPLSFATTTTPAPSFGSFGAATAAPKTSGGLPFASSIPSSSSGAVTTTTPATGISSGIPSAAPSAAASVSAAPTGSAFSFGLPSSTVAPTTQTVATVAPSTAASSLPTMSFGQPPATTTSGVSATVVPGEQSMTFRDLEEMINQWSLLLDDQEKIFLDQATQLNAWDRLLQANAEKVDLVINSSKKIKADQDRMEQELDFISSQHRELEEALKPLEEEADKEFKKISEISINDPLTADGQRAAIFRKTVEVDSQLRTISSELKTVIEKINARADADLADDVSSSGSERNPISQVCQILNAHMDSIKWIDQSLQHVEGQLEDVEKVKKQLAAARTPGRVSFL